VPLDSEHLAGYPRYHCGGVARSGADLEHPVPGGNAGGIDHQRDDVRLADRLLFANRQRAVLIGELAQRFRNEALARDRAKGIEDRGRFDSAAAELPLDHAFALLVERGHGLRLP
jgi:hypothetical protein